MHLRSSESVVQNEERENWRRRLASQQIPLFMYVLFTFGASTTYKCDLKQQKAREIVLNPLYAILGDDEV